MNDNKRIPAAVTPEDNAKARAKEEAQLDESIDESFPASDPSSVTRAPRDKRYAVKAPEHGGHRRTPAKPGPEA